MSRIWMMMTEAKAGAAAKTLPELSGARIFVECGIACHDIQSALMQTKKELAAEGFELIEVTRCIMYDLDHWDFEDYPRDSDFYSLAKNVVASGETWFGPFCFGPAE